jgi:hypothetical protein
MAEPGNDALKPFVRRSYGGAWVNVRRCQALNTFPGYRHGKQCRNVVGEGETYCHVHRPEFICSPEKLALGDVEICFQFDDDDPQVLMEYGPGTIGRFSIEMGPVFTETDSRIEFADLATGKRFRLFARRSRDRT